MSAKFLILLLGILLGPACHGPSGNSPNSLTPQAPSPKALADPLNLKGDPKQGYIVLRTDLDRLLVKLKKPHLVTPRDCFYAFFTDENYKYVPRVNEDKIDFNTYDYSSDDYDLGIEKNFGVFFLDPHDKNSKEFLTELNNEFPDIIKDFQKDVAQPKTAPKPFALDEFTRLADNNIQRFLVYAKDDPRKMALMRRVLLFAIIHVGGFPK